MMLAFGFSINLLTLLALVLAIGLVVDDAIIVVENVNRHLEEGMQPIPAAIQAARELGGPIIAMTVVLIAVYVPIGFQGGLTGALFTEFAFTLVGAVTVSAIIALTLSPMMCSRLLKPHGRRRPRLGGRGWSTSSTASSTACAAATSAGCTAASNYLPVTGGLRGDRPGQHLFPLQRRPRASSRRRRTRASSSRSSTSAPNATLDQRLLYSRQIYDIFAELSRDRSRLPARRAGPVASPAWC